MKLDSDYEGTEVECDEYGLSRYCTWGVKVNDCFHYWTTTYFPEIVKKRDELAAEHPTKTVVIAPFRLSTPRWRTDWEKSG